MEIWTVEEACDYFGQPIKPGEYEIQLTIMNSLKGYVHTYKGVQLGSPVKIKVVDNSEYDHGNGD